LQEADTSKQSITKRLSNHPIIVLSGYVIGIISCIFSIYIYFASRTFPELTYWTHPVRTIVMKAGQASRLKAIYDDKVVDTDISAVQITIWNKGKQAIKRSNILKPVVLSTGNNVPILEASIRTVSRDIINVRLNTDELQKGCVTILWDILEHNDGCVIQLIYAGDLSVNISLEGIMECQSYIKSQSTIENVNESIVGYIFLLLLSIFLIYAYLDKLYQETKFQFTKKNIYTWVFSGFFVIIGFVMIYYSLCDLLFKQGPPFVF